MLIKHGRKLFQKNMYLVELHMARSLLPPVYNFILQNEANAFNSCFNIAQNVNNVQKYRLIMYNVARFIKTKYFNDICATFIIHSNLMTVQTSQYKSNHSQNICGVIYFRIFYVSFFERRIEYQVFKPFFYLSTEIFLN